MSQIIFEFLIILSGAAHINVCWMQSLIWAVGQKHNFLKFFPPLIFINDCFEQTSIWAQPLILMVPVVPFFNCSATGKFKITLCNIFWILPFQFFFHYLPISQLYAYPVMGISHNLYCVLNTVGFVYLFLSQNLWILFFLISFSVQCH